MKTIGYIIRKEFQQFRRDPRMYMINLVAPVLQLILLGYAATLELKVIHTTIYDQDRTETSRKFIEKFTSTNIFVIDQYAESYSDVQNYIDRGKSLVAIVIPKDFEKNIYRKETAKVQAIFNGSDGNSASIAGGYIAGIISNYSTSILQENLELSGRKFIPLSKVTGEIRIWYNPELTTRYFMVPGIVGLLLSIITLILTSLAIVKEKELGTLEQIIVTPIKPYQLIIGKLIPFTILGLVSILIVLTAMNVIFSIAIRGSVVFILFSSLLYILSTLGLGLFVSTISKTQQQAMMIAIFAVMMPIMFLSGFAFPIENMPKIIQMISYVIPLRYFLNIVRGVILKGIGFEELWMDVLALFIIGTTILTLSAMRFRKRLE